MTGRPRPGIPRPGPSEILRASQKDSHFIKKLQEDLNDVVQQVLGQRVWQKWRESPHSAYLPTAMYYTLTNFAGFQTLGEEYAGILQVDKGGHDIPSKKALAIMIILTTLGQPFLGYVLKLLEGYLAKQRALEDSTSTSNAGRTLEKLAFGDPDQLVDLEESESWIVIAQGTLHVFQHYLPFLGQLHLALFYLKGRFYEFSKRITGVQYVLVRRWFAHRDKASRQNLKYLMWMSVINSMLTAVNDSVTFIKSKKKEWQSVEEDEPKYLYSSGRRWSTSTKDSNEVSPSQENGLETQNLEGMKKCSLCLEQRNNSSVTPCGHLFCWTCIIDWLRTKQECPVCREQFEPSRVVPLRNYT